MIKLELIIGMFVCKSSGNNVQRMYVNGFFKTFICNQKGIQQMLNCAWDNGQPLAYRNWADDMTIINKHASVYIYSHDKVFYRMLKRSFAIHWIITRYDNDENFTFLEPHYDKNKQPDYGIPLPTVHNHSLLCGMISTRFLTFGKWLLVNCTEKIPHYAIVCEKRSQQEALEQKKLRRSTHECLHNEVYAKGFCFTLVRRKEWKQANISFNMLLFKRVETYLTKWSRGRTHIVGYSSYNTSHGLCFKKLCVNCKDHDNHDWHHQNLTCPMKTTEFWLHQSREVPVEAECATAVPQHQCGDGTCIMAQYKCDNIPDCPDRSDEVNCSSVCTANYNCSTYCPKGHCVCNSNYVQIFNKCTPLYIWYEQWTHSQYISMPSLVMAINTSPTCPDGWLKCNPKDSCQCYPNANICVFERTFYGDSKHCPNTNHLQNCDHHQCPSMFTCNDSYCIPFHMVCDGVADCPDGRDEEHYHCATLSCPGMLKCRHDGICIHPNYYCDGVVHCLMSQDDELFCKICPVDCQCLGHTMFCYKMQPPFPNRINTVVGLFIDTVYGIFHLNKYNMNLNILYISNVSMTSPGIHKTINIQTQLKSLTMINNNLKKLESFAFSNLCGLLYLVIQMNWIRQIDPHAFSGLHSINYLNLSNLHIHTLGRCAFCHMTTLIAIDISGNYITHITVEIVQFSHPIDSLDISNNHIKYLDTDALTNNVHSLITNQVVLCCYVREILPSCKLVDIQPPCNVILINDPTSYACALFVTFLLLINMYVVIYRMSSSVSHFTVIQHLSISYLCYVAYLMVLTCTHFWYESQFPIHQDIWLQSIPCNLATFVSVLFILQSKCSLLLVEVDYVLVTTYSLTKRPLGSKTITYLLSSMWAINIAIAAIFSRYTEATEIYCAPYSRNSKYKMVLHIIFTLVLTARGIFMVVCYTLITNTVYKSSHSIKQSNSHIKKLRFKLLMVKAIITFGVFVLSNCSLVVALFWSTLGRHQWLELIVLMICIPFDSIINPFQYTIIPRIRRSKNHQNKKNIN